MASIKENIFMNFVIKKCVVIGLCIGLISCSDDSDVDKANKRTNDTNAQIMTLQQQINILLADSDTAAVEIAELESQIAFLQGSVTRRDQVVAVLKALETGDSGAVTQFISADTYIQHNLQAESGRDGLLALFDSGFLDGTQVDIRRVFTDGDFVFTHSQYQLFGQPMVGFDVFRFNQAGQIVEHWDNLQAGDGDLVSPVNGNALLDGIEDATALPLTEANKALVQDFVEEVLVAGRTTTFDLFFNPDTGDGTNYIQHNPNFPNGSDGLKAFLEGLEAAGRSLYTELHTVMGMGNFVLAMAEGNDANFDGIIDDNRTAYYDLFRVEGGKIVEHWDIIEEIPSESERANDNGKFFAQELFEQRAVNILEALEVTAQDAPYAEQISVWQDSVSNTHYTQHNQIFPSGRQTVLDAFTAGMLDGTAVDVRRTFVDIDENVVVAHVDYTLFGESQVGFDVFRFDNNEIVEHWDNLMMASGDQLSSINGNSLLDGSINVKDKQLTKQNKALVKAFVNDILVGGDTSGFDRFFNPENEQGTNYIQHNPDFPNGTQALRGFLADLEQRDLSFYSSLEFIYGEGNFVLAMSQGNDIDFDGIDDVNATAFFDLFRVEGGKIVEHWDVIQTILNDNEAANENGKW